MTEIVISALIKLGEQRRTICSPRAGW